MGSIILFDRNSQVDRVDSLRRAENGDFQKEKKGEKEEKINKTSWHAIQKSHCPPWKIQLKEKIIQ